MRIELTQCNSEVLLWLQLEESLVQPRCVDTKPLEDKVTIHALSITVAALRITVATFSITVAAFSITVATFSITAATLTFKSVKLKLICLVVIPADLFPNSSSERQHLDCWCAPGRTNFPILAFRLCCNRYAANVCCQAQVIALLMLSAILCMCVVAACEMLEAVCVVLLAACGVLAACDVAGCV